MAVTATNEGGSGGFRSLPPSALNCKLHHLLMVMFGQTGKPRPPLPSPSLFSLPDDRIHCSNRQCSCQPPNSLSFPPQVLRAVLQARDNILSELCWARWPMINKVVRAMTSDDCSTLLVNEKHCRHTSDHPRQRRHRPLPSFCRCCQIETFQSKTHHSIAGLTT